MKKEYIAIYEGDIDLLYKKEIDHLILFESKIIDGEMWFVMQGEGNEDFKYHASVVFADDDWIVVDKNILSVTEKNYIIFKFDPKEISVEEMVDYQSRIIEDLKCKFEFIFIPKTIDVDVFDNKQYYIKMLKDYIKDVCDGY